VLHLGLRDSEPPREVNATPCGVTRDFAPGAMAPELTIDSFYTNKE